VARADKPLPSMAYLAPRVRATRIVSALSYVGLLLSLFIFNALIADLHGANPVVILGVLLVPLLIFAPGIATGHVRTHAWLMFAINLYFIHGVLTCFQEGRLAYGLLLVGFSVVYFIAAMGYVRWSFQAARVAAGER
jgi:uncharacterized membrane protein